MSKNLSLYPPANLQSKIIQPSPMGFCTPIANGYKPSVVTVTIPWLAYGASINNPNLAVAINLQAGLSSGQQLDAIRSIKIDNSFCAVPVFVVFSDTGDIVSCPANAIVVANVAANAQTCVVYGTGFYTGRPPQTTIEFFNVGQPPLFIPGTLLDTLDVRFLGGPVTGSVGAVTTNFTNINVANGAPASPTRLIVAAIVNTANVAGAFTLVSATIGGVPATIAVQTNTLPAGAANNCNSAIVYAIVPTGTNISVTATYNIAVGAGGCSLWGVGNYTQLAPASTDFSSGTGISNLRLCQFNGIPGAGLILSAGSFGTVSLDPWRNAEGFATLQVATGSLLAASARAKLTENDAYVAGIVCADLVGAMWI